MQNDSNQNSFQEAVLVSNVAGYVSIRILSSGILTTLPPNELKGTGLKEGDRLPVALKKSFLSSSQNYSYLEGRILAAQRLEDIKNAKEPVIAFPRDTKPGGLVVLVLGVPAFLKVSDKEAAELLEENAVIPVLVEAIDKNNIGKPEGIQLRRIPLSKGSKKENSEVSAYIFNNGYRCNVTRIDETGAVVKFKDYLCWLPNKEVSWNRLTKAKHLLKSGQTIGCRFLPDQGDGKIYVSMLVPGKDPWSINKRDGNGKRILLGMKEGDEVKGILRHLDKDGLTIDTGKFSIFVPRSRATWPGTYTLHNYSLKSYEWNEGSTIKIKIKKFDFTNREIEAECVKKDIDPWLEKRTFETGLRNLAGFTEGSAMSGTILYIKDKEVIINVNGIICQLKKPYGPNIRFYPGLKEGQDIPVRIESIDWINRTVDLSLLSPKEWRGSSNWKQARQFRYRTGYGESEKGEVQFRSLPKKDGPRTSNNGHTQNKKKENLKSAPAPKKKVQNHKPEAHSFIEIGKKISLN